MKVWNAVWGFGEVIGAYTYGRVRYLKVRWDANPWCVDDCAESEVEFCQ